MVLLLCFPLPTITTYRTLQNNGVVTQGQKKKKKSENTPIQNEKTETHVEVQESKRYQGIISETQKG